MYIFRPTTIYLKLTICKHFEHLNILSDIRLTFSSIPTMQRNGKDIIPEKFDFEEEIARLMVEYDLIAIADRDESESEDSEFDDDSDSHIFSTYEEDS